MVIVGIKTNEEADKAVLEMDAAVREITAALDSGKVRPSASGLVSDACFWRYQEWLRAGQVIT